MRGRNKPDNFDEFVRETLPHLDALLRAACAMCRDRARAEDLVQTTYLKALRRCASYRTGSNAKAWLMRILHNTWVDQLRHRRVVGPTVPADEALLAAEETQAEMQTIPDELRAGEEDLPRLSNELLDSFEDEEIIKAMGELPDEQRLCLYLIDVEDFSQEEVAEIAGVAVGTIKSRTSRARARLRNRLAAHAKDLGFPGR